VFNLMIIVSTPMSPSGRELRRANHVPDGLTDPLHDTWLNVKRLGTAVRQLARPQEGVVPHLAVDTDLGEAIRVDRAPAIAPNAVTGTILTLEGLSRMWQEYSNG
jgi:hypothetical protein